MKRLFQSLIESNLSIDRSSNIAMAGTVSGRLKCMIYRLKTCASRTYPFSNYIFFCSFVLCLHFEFNIQSSFSQMTFFSIMCCHYIKLPGLKCTKKKNSKRWKANTIIAKSLFIHSLTMLHRIKPSNALHAFIIIVNSYSFSIPFLGWAKPSLVCTKSCNNNINKLNRKSKYANEKFAATILW